MNHPLNMAFSISKVVSGHGYSARRALPGTLPPVPKILKAWWYSP